MLTMLLNPPYVLMIPMNDLYVSVLNKCCKYMTCQTMKHLHMSNSTDCLGPYLMKNNLR